MDTVLLYMLYVVHATLKFETLLRATGTSGKFKVKFNAVKSTLLQNDC